MSDDARTRRLRELVEKWMAQAAERMNPPDGGLLKHPALMVATFHQCADELAAVLDTEGDRQERANCSMHPTGDHEWVCLTCLEAKDEPSEPIVDTEGDASPAPPEGIAHEWRFDTIIGHYRCNRCLARDDGSHGPTCPKAILPDPPVQP